MKKILLMLFFLPVVSFAWQNDYFKITSEGPYEPGNKILVSINKSKLSGEVSFLKLKVGNNFLYNDGKGKGAIYKFKIHNKLDYKNRQLFVSIILKNKKKESYSLNIQIPYFLSINAIDLKGNTSTKINFLYEYTGNCKLITSGGNFGIISTGNITYVKIPGIISYPIYGGYISCEGLNSNYVKFYIPSSPRILYLRSKHSPIIPGDTLIIKGKNIKLHPNDNIQILLNGKPIKFKEIDANTYQVTLPSQNFLNGSIKIIRNGFESNELKFSVQKHPIILNITTNYSSEPYFEIYGNFDFSLGEPSVYLDGQSMPVLFYQQRANISLIKVEFPKPMFFKNDFSCSSYLKDGTITVDIGNVESNKFYYVFDKPLKIQSVNFMCNNLGCGYEIYTNKNLPMRFKLLLNGKIIKNISDVGNKIVYYTKSPVPKGKFQILFSNCLLSDPYYFDLTDKIKPKPVIQYLISKDKFKGFTDFTIEGQYLTHTNVDLDLHPKVILQPNVLNITGTYYGFSDINVKLKDIKDGEKVMVKVSNDNGYSNEAYFIAGKKKQYTGGPILTKVLYPNGGFAGSQVEVKGYNFSENCTENQIYLGEKVIYPDECNSNKLIFSIPRDVYTDNISVAVNGLNTNPYKLLSKIGGQKLIDKFEFKGFDVNVLQPGKYVMHFQLLNPYTDLYLPTLSFLLKTNQFLPLSDFNLSINNDFNQYQLDFVNKTLIKAGKLKGFIQKISDNTYKLTFNNVYIPYSNKIINLNMSFVVDSASKNNQNIGIYSPENVKIYNIYSNKFKDLKLNSIQLASYKIYNLQNFCFDADSTYKNCALVLRGQQPKFTQQKTSTDQQSTKSQQSIVSKPTKDVSQTQKPLTREEKIAQRLALQKMELLNNVLYSFIKQMKNKYRNNKTKLKYIVEMYRGYKQMIANTSDNMQAKVNYVKGLIYFAKNYFAFVKAN